MIAGMFLLAAFTNGLRNSDQTPPLTLRRVLIRAVLAGIAAMASGLLAIDRMTIGWAFLLGAAGAIGYVGQEVLLWIALAGRRVVGAFIDSVVNNRTGGGKGDA